jgi:C_GCAxxG_C_C family probable redox protein
MELFRMKNTASERGEEWLCRWRIFKTSLFYRAAALLGVPSATTIAGEPHDVSEDAPNHALDRFMKSGNCSQAILETYAPSMGLPKETARRLAAAFAGGMGMGSECGAVTGALMVIGLKCGKIHDRDPAADRRTSAKTAEFLKKFRARHHDTECSRLLDVNMGTPGGVEEARRRGLFKTKCPEFVRSASEILDRILV